MTVSILVCTRNRADHLRATLRSFATVVVPSGWSIELIVVDNGSTDATADVIATEAPARLAPRRVEAHEPGLSHARNAGLAAARGDVILFTDDDVRVPRDWIERMCTPILDGRADAVAGGVCLAPDLLRPWMTGLHTSALADTKALVEAGGIRLVGANMAIARSVFDVIPTFDPELGAGQLGFHEETLLTLQMKQHQYRILPAYDVTVEHHPAADRLSYRVHAEGAAKMGRSDAYLDHHWRHARASWSRSVLVSLYWALRLVLFRGSPGVRPRWGEGIDPDEIDIRRRIAYHRQMRQYVGTPRNYEQYGTRKHGGVRAGGSLSDRDPNKGRTDPEGDHCRPAAGVLSISPESSY